MWLEFYYKILNHFQSTVKGECCVHFTHIQKSETMEISRSVKNVGLIILNSDYTKSETKGKYLYLPSVQDDGPKMAKMLHKYEIDMKSNVQDILRELKLFVQKYEADDSNIERVHFHFSGHGVHNAKVFLEDGEKKKATVSQDGTRTSKTPVGECLVGTSGKLYSLHDVKHELLKLQSKTIIISYDCCRSQLRGSDTRGLGSGAVKLQKKEPISNKNQEKIIVLYGSLDGLYAYDSHSFTNQLFKVTEKGNKSIPILKLASVVNESWRDTDQRCKVDLVEVGDNWADFKWPSNDDDEMEEKRSMTEGSPKRIISPEIDITILYNKLVQIETGVANIEMERQRDREAFLAFKDDVERFQAGMLSIESPVRKRKSSSTTELNDEL